MAEQFANNAETTLNGAIDDIQTNIVVASGALPLPQTAQFRILIEEELMIVTGGAGTTNWVVTRHAEGTTAAPHGDLQPVVHVFTAGAMGELKTLANISNPNAAALNGMSAFVRGTLDDADATTFLGSVSAVDKRLFNNKGDLIGATGADAPALIPAGTDGYVLTRNDASSTGVSWLSFGSVDLTALKEAAPSIEYPEFAGGAVIGSDAQPAIQDAVNTKRKIIIPWKSGTWRVDSRTIIGDNGFIQLDGNVNAGGVAGDWPGESGTTPGTGQSAHAMFYWKPSGTMTEGHNGGMEGRGQLDCKNLAHYGTDVESWDNISFQGFKIINPGRGLAGTDSAHMHFRPGGVRPDTLTGGRSPSVDCDACDMSHLTLGYAAPTSWPDRGMLFRDAGGNDSEVRNCKLNGFAPTNTSGASDALSGGYGIECRNSGRIRIISSYIGDNQNKITGAVLIRHDRDDPVNPTVYHENPVTIRDLYVEAGHQVVGADAKWLFTCVKIEVASGVTTAASREHLIDGLEFQYAGNILTTAGNARRLWMINNGGSQMLQNVSYINPKDHLSAFGQIHIGDNCDNNYIELMSTSEGAFVNDTFGGTNNKVVSKLYSPTITGNRNGPAALNDLMSALDTADIVVNNTNEGVPTVTGSRGGNAALADLLVELNTLGIITNSTTA